MNKLAILCLAALLLVGCTDAQKRAAVPVVEAGVDVGVGLCAAYEPAFAWVCKLADTEIDAALNGILSNMGMAMDVQSIHAAPLEKKQRALLQLLNASTLK